jgi:hypothetical protein
MGAVRSISPKIIMKTGDLFFGCRQVDLAIRAARAPALPDVMRWTTVIRSTDYGSAGHCRGCSALLNPAEGRR